MTDVEQSRERFEQLVLRVSTEEIGEEDSYEVDRLDTSPHEARVVYRSRHYPSRTAGVALALETLSVHFFIERKPDLNILLLDDYSIEDDGYSAERVREVVRLIAAFLRGEGAVEPKRNLLGRWRAQPRLRVDGREWVAR